MTARIASRKSECLMVRYDYAQRSVARAAA
jgi:hypothetical protein